MGEIIDAHRQEKATEDDMPDRIRRAMADQEIAHYTMSLVGDDIQAVIDAVNVGIDAYLTACNCPERGDSYQHGDRSITATSDTEHWKSGDRLRLAQTLECIVSAESLPVLLRRLDDGESEAALSLRDAILSTLEIEE